MKSFKLRKEFVSAHPDIAEQLESKDYDFFDTEKHCKSGIILLGLGGSHAYGTNIKTSDIDIRGVALNTPDEILGNHSFEVFTEKNTDTTIYSINKFIKLCADCNPNVIELLGLRNEDYRKCKRKLQSASLMEMNFARAIKLNKKIL